MKHLVIPKERIYATGIPIMDVYDREKTKQECIQNFMRYILI